MEHVLEKFCWNNFKSAKQSSAQVCQTYMDLSLFRCLCSQKSKVITEDKNVIKQLLASFSKEPGLLNGGAYLCGMYNDILFLKSNFHETT